MSVNIPDMPRHATEWGAWTFRVLVMVFFAVAGYLGKTAVDDIRTTKDTVIEMHAAQQFRDATVNDLRADVRDHEVRLRSVERITSTQPR